MNTKQAPSVQTSRPDPAGDPRRGPDVASAAGSEATEQATLRAEACAEPPVDVPSFEEVFVHHRHRVHQHALRLTGNSSDADDLTPEVFIRVLRYLPRFDPRIGTVEGWLWRITKNCFVNEVQQRRRVQVRPAEGLDRRPAEGPDPAEIVDRRVVATDLQAALRILPSWQARAVVLHDIDGLDYASIAAELNVARGTVGSRLCRAHARLRTQLTRPPAQQPGGISPRD